MKRFLLFFIICVIAMVPITGCKQAIPKRLDSLSAQTMKPLTQKEMLDDFEYMYNILKENYPFFELNKRVNKKDWVGLKNEYINMIKAAKNDEDFLSAMNKILKDLNNGHTHMVSTNQQYENFKRNEGQTGPWSEQLNIKSAVARYSNIADIGVQATGNTIQKNPSSGNVTMKILEDGKTAYLRVKSFNHLLIEEDAKKITLFFDEIKKYRTLIIDIRGNGGGSDSYWIKNIVSRLTNKPISYKFYYVFRGGNFAEKFIKHKLGIEYKDMKVINTLDENVLFNAPAEIKKEFKYYYEYKNTISPSQSIDFKGKIYLAVDRQVYSSSEMFAVFAKSTKFATIVGERTGGDGIGIGPILCVLPNSGYIFRFSQVMGLTSDGICNDEFKTEPDIEVPAKMDSNIYNDLTIQRILNIEK